MCKAGATHGLSRRNPVYHICQAAKSRCQNPNNPNYENYGGRGIQFKWETAGETAQWIIEHLGEKPPGKSLDRIDNDGHYEPGNLRWATPKEQALNQRKRCVAEKMDCEAMKDELRRRFNKLGADIYFQIVLRTGMRLKKGDVT